MLSSSDSIFVEKILTNDLLFQIVFDASSPATLLRLSRTCHTAHTAVNWYIPLRFDVNRYISPYFSDYLTFRSLQALTGTLISGSTALQFFVQEIYAGADLDLYVSLKYKEAICRFVIAEGYTFKPSYRQEKDFEKAITTNSQPSDIPYKLDGIAYVFTFTKEIKTAAVADGVGLGSAASLTGVAADGMDVEDDSDARLNVASETKQIQVIVVETAPMEVILNYHSTVVMNVIAWDRAYCLYARGTLVDRCTVYTRSSIYQDEGVIWKYETRGWQFLSEDDSSRDRSWLPLVPRWIGDGHSWTIKLSTKGMMSPSPINGHSLALSRDPCAGTTWNMCIVPDERFYTQKHFEMSFRILEGNTFEHMYVSCYIDPGEKVDYLKQAMLAICGGSLDDVPCPPIQYFDEDFMRYIAIHLEREQEWTAWEV